MSASRTTFLALALATLAYTVPASAQDDPGAKQLVDRIIAVVGDSAILMSEMETGLRLAESQGWSRPSDPAQLFAARSQMLDQLINEQLLIQDAALDTTLVIEDQILDDAVDQEIEAQVRQHGTQGLFQQALDREGYTVASYREDRREFFRRQMIRERYMAKRAIDPRAVQVTPEEVEQFYLDNVGRMPQRPASIEFVNYRMLPQASDTAWANALQRAQEILLEARDNPSEFATLAEKYSMGPSREVGGELGWLRDNGQFDPDFEDAVFRLFPGFVSDPIKTQFGYHLILVERVRGGERRVRHLLIIPTVSEQDLADNLVRAEEARRLIDEGESLDALPGVEADTLIIPTDRLGDLSNFYAREMADAQPGEIFGPLPLNDPQRQNVMGIAVVVQVRDGGVASLEDMRAQIEPTVRDSKLLETVVEGLRARTFIDIRLTAN